MTTQTTTCPTCGGTGIDPSRASQSLAMPGFNVYIAAMYPCPDCSGRGEIAAGECGRKGCVGYKPDHDHELAF